jgi:hypothetical protein
MAETTAKEAECWHDAPDDDSHWYEPTWDPEEDNHEKAAAAAFPPHEAETPSTSPKKYRVRFLTPETPQLPVPETTESLGFVYVIYDSGETTVCCICASVEQLGEMYRRVTTPVDQRQGNHSDPYVHPSEVYIYRTKIGEFVTFPPSDANEAVEWFDPPI